MGSIFSRIAFACALIAACAPPAETVDGEGSGEAVEDERPIVEAVTLDTTDFEEFIDLVGVTSAIRSAASAAGMTKRSGAAPRSAGGSIASCAHVSTTQARTGASCP